jgi:hypothetical protein
MGQSDDKVAAVATVLYLLFLPLYPITASLMGEGTSNVVIAVATVVNVLVTAVCAQPRLPLRNRYGSPEWSKVFGCGPTWLSRQRSTFLGEVHSPSDSIQGASSCSPPADRGMGVARYDGTIAPR